MNLPTKKEEEEENGDSFIVGHAGSVIAQPWQAKPQGHNGAEEMYSGLPLDSE